MDLLAWVKLAVAWIPGRHKTMFLFLLLSSLALFLPALWQKNIGIYPWTSVHPVLEWSTFVFCGGILLLEAMDSGYKVLSEKKKIDRRLSDMTDEEKMTVGGLLNGPASTIAWPYESRVVSLYTDGVLSRSPDKLDNGSYAYMLSPIARKIMLKDFNRRR